jgi:hypothetical protein
MYTGAGCLLQVEPSDDKPSACGLSPSSPAHHLTARSSFTHALPQNIVKVSAIPTFGPDGSRRREYSIEAALYLESRKTLYLQRRGKTIVSGHWYGEGSMPLQNRLKTGTRYSHRERVGDRKAWTHRPLPIYRVEKAKTTAEFYAELTERQAAPFVAVTLSCIENKVNSGE